MMKKTPQEAHRQKAAKDWHRRDIKILREYLDDIEAATARPLPRDPDAAHELLQRHLDHLRADMMEKRARSKQLYDHTLLRSSHD
jgi:DNA-binding GntR family transcriptional regulator